MDAQERIPAKWYRIVMVDWAGEHCNRMVMVMIYYRGSFYSHMQERMKNPCVSFVIREMLQVSEWITHIISTAHQKNTKGWNRWIKIGILYKHMLRVQQMTCVTLFDGVYGVFNLRLHIFSRWSYTRWKWHVIILTEMNFVLIDKSQANKCDMSWNWSYLISCEKIDLL